MFVCVPRPPFLASCLLSAAVDSQICTSMSIKFLLIEDIAALRLSLLPAAELGGEGKLRATDWLQALRRRAEINLQ